MARSLMLCLLWLSSLCLSSCYVAKGTKAMDIFTNCPPVYQPAIQNAQYSAQIDFFKKHFSGIFLFKTLNDTSQRVVFMSETGFKFFDFEYGPHHFAVQYIIPGLNKKVIINILRRDIGYLVQPPSENSARQQTKTDTYTLFKFPHGKDADYYYADTKCEQLQKIEAGSDRRKHITIDLTGRINANPEMINLSDKHVKLTIFLRQISNS